MMRLLVRGRGWPAAAALAAVCWLLSVSSIREKSNVFDEMAHLTAGYSYWLTGQYRLHTENGNLPQRFGALAALWRSCRFVSPDDPDFVQGNVWQVGRKFFFELGNPIEEMLFEARALMALTGPALVLLVFCWSRALWGVPGALISSALTALCPTVLANAPLMTSDAMAALFFLLATALAWRLLHGITAGNLISALLCVAGLALSKMSAPLIAPVLLALCCLRMLRAAPLRLRLLAGAPVLKSRLQKSAALACLLVLSGLASVLLIWAGFGFCREHTRPPQVWEAVARQPGGATRAVAWANDRSLLPEPYLYGMAFVLYFAERRAAFLNGEYSTTGWLSFFPYSFLLKTPLPVFFLCLLAAGLAITRARSLGPPPWARIARSLYKISPLLVFLLIYCGTALASNLNIGHRHLLPIYPAVYILAGSVALMPALFKKIKWCIPAVILALLAEMMLVWPNYLAYFNALGGGPRQAYRHFVDSSLDWGQELGNLKRWLAEARLDLPGAPPVYLSYFGTASIRHLNIRAELLPCFFDQPSGYGAGGLRAGVYCISASMLQCVYVSHAPGPNWSSSYETKYRQLKSAIELRGFSDAAGLALGGFARMKELEAFRQMQFAKLCASLRQREPDFHINHSILIYYLNQADINKALSMQP